MSLIDLASLVLAPTATKEGKVYSAIPDTGDGDMTFTRGSSATRVNSAGLIEKERGNILYESNNFSSGYWNYRAGDSSTGGQAGYDGTNDAWLLSVTNGGWSVYQNYVGTGVHTFSLYVKAGTANIIQIDLFSASTTYSGQFNLSNGTDAGGSNSIDRNIISVGGGWYRVSFAANISSTLYARIGTVSQTGNFYIQDAQLEYGLVATDYIETTTSAVYEGITDDVPRVDYSGGGCPSLLLEGQRTNSYTNSEYFDDWLSNRLDRTANNIISPEGVQNAYKMTQQSGFTTAPNINKGGIAAGTYTVSIFAKKGSWNYLAISFQGVSYFNLEAGSKGTINSNHTATIEDYGNGWYRCAITRTTTTTQTPAFYFAESDNTLTTPDTQGYMYAYGAMLEAGSYSTSYIPTYSVSSTRVADSCSKTGISELIGQTEGTLFAEFKIENLENLSTRRLITLSNGNANTRIVVYLNSLNKISIYIVDGGVAQWDYTGTILTAGTYKIAVGYAANDFVLYVNGIIESSDSSGSVPATNRIDIGNQLGSNFGEQPVNQALLFPTRLTNDQLQELTK